MSQRFSLEFWPKGLRSISATGANTRCEPDLVATVEFNDGPPLIIVGEMKWDSYPSKAELEAQIVRERNTIKEANPKAEILMFAFVKFKKQYMGGEQFNRASCLVFEWTEFHQALNRYLSTSPAQESARRRWASDISEFLVRAEQTIFTGIKEGYSPLKNPWSNGFMVVTRDGRLREQEAWEACRTNRHADGKLLEWAKAAQGKNWAQRGWIFALPLRSFKDPESVDKQLIQPVLRLLVKNDNPDMSLAGTAAIKWSQQPTNASSLTDHSK